MADFASVQDIIDVKRALTESEISKAEKLIPLVSSLIRTCGSKCGVNVDQKAQEDSEYANVVKLVCVDAVFRQIIADTNSEPMTQLTQSALGYSVSGTYALPTRDIGLLNNELKRLGFRRQKFGVIEFS